LAWEIGPGKQKRYSLTISAEGRARVRPLANKIVSLAPTLDEWEFYASRQPRPAPPTIALLGESDSVATQYWRYLARFDTTPGRVDLEIFSDDLSQLPEDKALNAVQIYLDAVFGEDTVEDYIGSFSVYPSAADSGKSRPIIELPGILHTLRT
jgi:hypothetical protein